MMKVLVLVILLFSSGPFAQQSPMGEGKDFYSQVLLGQKPAPMYKGPLSPEGEFSALTGEFHFLDDIHYNNYLNAHLERGLFDLSHQWFHELPISSACPNFYLDQNIHYIRYLFRLITMSYLFESMKALNVSLHQLGFDRNACSISWHQTFARCEPRNEDMKKFVERVQFRFLHDFDRGEYYRLAPKDLQTWNRNFKADVKKDESQDVTRSRLLAYCREEGKNCDSLKNEDIRDALVSSCSYDRELIQHICSEKDELFGLSYVDELISLLTQSNVINVINSGGHGESCLKRFVSVFKEREKRDLYLSKFFPVIKEKLSHSKERYIQGSLFLPGALKEFDLRGLDNFLFTAPVVAEKPAEPAPVVVVEVPKVVAPTPKPEPVVVVEIIPEPEPTPIPEDRPSQFKIAYEELVATEKDRVLVNMEKFKGDFVFSERMIKALEEPLKEYQTRSALQEMKKFDLLGTANEPVRLIFIKFLIDKNMHQGLFNIAAVLGETLYVVNDIDGVPVPVRIELLNNETTKYRWQITVLRE